MCPSGLRQQASYTHPVLAMMLMVDMMSMANRTDTITKN
jgi:hypothetical protein